MKIIFNSYNYFDCEMIKAKLADEGIDTYIMNEAVSQMLPSTSFIEKFLQVAVADEDYERAISIIKEIDSGADDISDSDEIDLKL